jgi:hypothetical protein
MELIECSETSANSTQSPGNHPKENILHLTHGVSLKSRDVEFHFQNKFEKLVHLGGFVMRKFVMMYGHMNVILINSVLCAAYVGNRGYLYYDPVTV